MSFLQTHWFQNSALTWMIVIVATGIVAFAAWVTLRRFARRWERAARQTPTRWDDLFVQLLYRTKWPFLAIEVAYLGTQFLVLAPTVRVAATRVAILALLIQVAVWGHHAVAAVADLGFWKRRAAPSVDRPSLTVLAFIGRAIVWGTILLVILDNLGINVTTLITGLGIGGIAIALAVQNVLGDLLASLSIVLDRPFAVGDFIRVDAFQGRVEHIGVKTTRLRSVSGEQLLIPNSDLLKSRIRNFERLAERRVVFKLIAAAATAPETVERVPAMVREIVGTRAGVRFERAHLQGVGATGPVFEVVFFVLGADYHAYMDAQHAVYLELLRRLPAAGVSFTTASS